MSDNDDSGSDCSQKIGRKRKLNLKSNSRGNIHLFQAQKRILNQPFVPKKPVSDVEANGILDGLSKCCLKSKCIGCVRKFFLNPESKAIDFNASVKYFKDCRELVRMLNPIEKNRFLSHHFQNCIKDRVQLGEGKEKLVMEYKSPINPNLILCKASFASVFDTSVSMLEKMSKIVKQQELCSDLIPTLKLAKKKYTDKTLHPYTYKQVSEIFERNLNFAALFGQVESGGFQKGDVG